MSVDLEQVKATIRQLKTKREALENERRELKFQLDKLEKEKAELEPQIVETFGTTDRDTLLAKVAELEQEAESLLKQAELVK